MKSEDIAKLAGVSRSTVSRVLNNYSNVPDQTRRKVMKVIREHNYVPNTPARILAGKGMNTLGLFIVSIDEKTETNRIYQNNYFAPFLDIVVDVANNNDFYALVHTVYSERDYAKIQKAFQEKRIDGGIVVGTKDDTISFLQPGNSFPLVFIDYNFNHLVKKGIDQNVVVINSSDDQGVVAAIEYLLELGHTEIGMIAGRQDTHSGRVRLETFLKVMCAKGLPLNPYQIIHGNFIKSVTYKETKKLIQKGKFPTAFISANDDMAMTAIRALDEEGINVPGDISIVGFDDVPVASQLKPALTTVHVPVYEMGCKAVESLIGMIDAKGSAPQVFNFPVELIKRETCIHNR